MSLKPKPADKRPEISDKNYRGKPLFSTDRKPPGSGFSQRKIPGSSGHSQAQSQACLHERGKKQSSLVKKTSSDQVKKTSSAARLKDTQIDKSPREALEKRLLEIHKGLMRGVYTRAQLINTEGGKEERGVPIEPRKSVRGLVNDVTVGDNILNRLSYKSMSSLSSDKKSVIIKDQNLSPNRKNLFSSHFQDYAVSSGIKNEKEKELKALKTSSSMSQNLYESSFSTFTRKAMDSFAKGVSSTGNLPLTKSITSIPTIEVELYN